MKNLFSVLGLFFIISSCEVQGELTNGKADNPEVLPSMASKYSGEFVSYPGESISGFAKIYLEKDHQLILENLIASGPDLKVYLSKSNKPVDFVNLGNLIKSKTTYQIPAAIDVEAYRYVIVYCQQYSVIFGVAQLTKS